MKSIAISIAVVIPENVNEPLLEASKFIFSLNKEGVKLGPNQALPHITLAMGAVHFEDLNQIKAIIQNKITALLPFPITTGNVQYGNHTTTLNILDTLNLQTLHEQVIGLLKPFLQKHIDASLFDSPNKVHDFDIDSAQNYAEKSSYSNFKPHITLGGKSEIEIITPQIVFQCTEVALFHLGEYCSVYKKLA